MNLESATVTCPYCGETVEVDVEPLEEVLISNFDFVRTRPDLPGTGSHDSGLFSQACHNPLEVVVSEGLIVRF